VVVALDGRLRLGPDVEYLPGRQCHYAVDAARRVRAAARRCCRNRGGRPDARHQRHTRQAQGPGQGFRDFVVAEESSRGLPGLVNLVGIDSPGLTASPAIAEEVARLLGE
jgi:L-2-hydroxyglutarate oxidase LhgO